MRGVAHLPKICTIEGCGRRLDASGKCSTHRRRARLGLPMHAPIRARPRSLSSSDLLEAAFDAFAVDDDREYARLTRRFNSMLKRWAASCR